MKNFKEYTDRELLEFIAGSQVQLMRKIDRIERHLEETGNRDYYSKNEHLDEVLKDISDKNDHSFN